MKIELNNKTHWRDDHIRAFLRPLIQQERPDLCKAGALALRVYIVYTRINGSCHSSGYAYLHSRTMKVRLSKHTPDKIDFAHVIAHELAHTRGLTHDRMNSCATYGRVGKWREIYAWAESLPLEVKPRKVKAKPQPDTKMEHCERMLKAALTREKRAMTIRKKWQTKIRYYRTILAKAAERKG